MINKNVEIQSVGYESLSNELKDSTLLYKPNLYHWQKEDLHSVRSRPAEGTASAASGRLTSNGVHFFLDGDSPNWIACDSRGAQILEWVNGKRSFGELLRLYAQVYELDSAKSWMQLHTFIKEALARGIIFLVPQKPFPYKGRAEYLKTKKLKEFWMHLTQSCNLSCTHCLVSSSPKGEKGAETNFYLQVIDEVCELGVERFYFTGGEPFVRADIFDLICYVTKTKAKELILMSNATLFYGERLENLKKLSREKVKFQVSIDGTEAETNDAIRGKGVFEKASCGLKILSDLGFETSLTAVVTPSNLKELEELPALAKKLGAKSLHLMWPHKRGRIVENTDLHGFSKTSRIGADKSKWFPTIPELLQLALAVKQNSEKLGILFDNLESLKLRVNGKPNVKYDLGNLCWESLCLYMDGHLYPSAAMAGFAPLSLGAVNGQGVKSLWLESKIAQKIRAASVAQKNFLKDDPFRFLTGGGDIEHSYFFSSNGSEGNFVAEDPYYSLYVELIKELMLELALEKKRSFNTKSGFNAPLIFHSMGEDAVTCSEDAQNWLAQNGKNSVRLLHSNCVLSFDVEKPYRAIQKFYSRAAEQPQKELCCPVKYEESEISHIPQEVIDRFYGCGSPISMAGVKERETVLDLGSGAGIDCFIAAKKVGDKGKVIGVDMTEQMLSIATQSKKIVARNLGYDVVEFRRGYLEKIPAEDRSVDLVTSNCVINLSPDKKKVFAEIWRILKDTGRFVVADIVSDTPVPLSLQAHQDLWGECISGALSEQEFLAQLEKAGFYGIRILKKIFWKEVHPVRYESLSNGVKFYSITVQGFKFEKKSGCKFIGQKAVYLGPYKATMDEEGHLFPRGEAVEICTDTAEKLKSDAYKNQFAVIESTTPSFSPPYKGGEGDESISSEQCCGPAGCC